MQNIKKYYLPFILLMGLFACNKHEYYQENPNRPSVGTPALLLTGIQVSIFNINHASIAYASRYLAYYERTTEAMTYNWSTGGFGAYNTMRQADDMALNGNNNYKGLAKFFRAVLFYQLTATFGDIPYTEAMQGKEGLSKPKYDTQKDVFAGILNDLEEANAMLDPTLGPIAGDIIFGNKPNQVLQWKKLINAFRLRLLINLSKKEADASLNIKQQFQSIISNPSKYPLLESIADNGQIVYNTSALNNAYPTFQSISFSTSVSMEKGFVKILKDRKDPRLFSFAEPVSGKPAGEFSSYEGVDGGLTTGDMQTTSAQASRIKERFSKSQVNEPTIFLGYAEQEFLIAEAISRNWITNAGTAKLHYDNGIKASMAFSGVTGAAVTNYLAEPLVAFNPATAIEQIITQKYIAFFMSSGWEPFYEQRRTGIPTFSVGPGTLNGGKVPKRWLYPLGEFTINEANVKAAVQSQYGGTETINSEMWLIK